MLCDGAPRFVRPICRRRLENPRRIFSQFEVQRGLPIQLLVKHFTQNASCGAQRDIRGWCSIPAEPVCRFLPSRVFESFSAATSDYFDQETKVGIFNGLRNVGPDGVLALEHRNPSSVSKRSSKALSGTAGPLSSNMAPVTRFGASAVPQTLRRLLRPIAGMS